jgi:spermidine/putrescine transport system ATP-binding protein
VVEDQGLTANGDRSAADPAVSIRGLRRSFGDIRALQGIDLDVGSGEFVSILGPSGCGKTTLLRIVGGFEYADAGDVYVGGRRMNDVPAHRRPVNTVFQRYALFPHKTVGDNIGFALKVARRGKAEIAARVSEMLRLVRLEGYERRTPASLSGGQAQRVALARALVNHPKVLLLDEPLAALDLKLRQAMHFELRRIQNLVGSTFVYVTHDQEEALTMSDRIVLMNSGRIEQIGSPVDVYRQPASRFVSGFIGEVNLLAGEVVVVNERSGGDVVVGVQAGHSKLSVDHPAPVPVGTSVWISLRPEQLSLSDTHATSPAATNRLAGTLQSSVFMGSFVRHLVNLLDGQSVIVQTPAESRFLGLPVGAELSVEWPETSGVLLCD